MRHTALLLIILGLAGCARPAAPTASMPPTARPSSVATARPTSTASTQPAAPSAIPTIVAPPLPTATAVPIQHARPGRLESSEGGLALDYPSNWRLSDPEEGLGTLAFLTNPNQTAYAVVYQGLRPSDRSLEEAASAAHADVYQWFDEIESLDAGSWEMDNGAPAWASEFFASTNGVPIYILMVTVAEGTRLVTLVTYCAEAIYDLEIKTLETIASSMRVSPPRVAGVSRADTLVMVGSESQNPQHYDPAHGGGHLGVFSGLVMLTPELQLAPDLAEGWTISADGRTYTFGLRPGLRFHNGRPLGAEDVVYAWERALAPDTASLVATSYLGDIAGAAAFHAGEAASVHGLRALDARTLEVTLEAPRPTFLQKLSAPVAMVIDRANIAAGPTWYRAPNGSGPYRLSRWVPGDYMLFERAPRYYLDPPAMPYIVIRLYGTGAFSLYEFDYVDLIDISSVELARARDPADPLSGELFEAASLCTSYLSLDSSRAPFDDPLVRRAFALATDRQRYTALALADEGRTAHGVFPPGLPGYQPDYRGLGHDPAAARELLADSRYASAMTPLTLSAPGYPGDGAAAIGTLARMWQDTLGVSVTVDLLEPDSADAQIAAGSAGQIALRSWCADYPDPENFADLLFRSGAGQNTGHYSNRELDGLLDQARAETNAAARLALYGQAERLIVDDAAAIVLAHPIRRVLVKPRVRGYALPPIRVPIERYLSVADTDQNP